MIISLLLFLCLPFDDIKLLKSDNYIERQAAEERLCKIENESILRKAIFTSDLEQKLTIKKILNRIEAIKLWLPPSFDKNIHIEPTPDTSKPFWQIGRFVGLFGDFNHISPPYSAKCGPLFISLSMVERSFKEIFNFYNTNTANNFNIDLIIECDPRIQLAKIENIKLLEFIVENKQVFGTESNNTTKFCNRNKLNLQIKLPPPPIDAYKINKLKLSLDASICYNHKEILLDGKNIDDDLEIFYDDKNVIIKNNNLSDLCYSFMLLKLKYNNKYIIKILDEQPEYSNEQLKFSKSDYEEIRLIYPQDYDTKNVIFEFNDVDLKKEIQNAE